MTDKKPTGETMTKRSFSYVDLINMKSDSIYNSMGSKIDPQLKTAPRATIGK